MRDILIVMRQIEDEKPIDFYCLLCGEHVTITGWTKEVRDRGDNDQLLGHVCQGCFLPSRWNVNVEKAIMKAERRLEFVRTLKVSDASEIRLKEERLPTELIE